ncbi:cupin domain-containing protein [Kaistia dalseonensis]|uniref:Quercetin dioxygenase-like cupin family protein n=1 Tax=Kaistia dalseonensis TaxID=410840 RepID=A0ABU0H6Z8_9HYPH|nr:cupin domain-containing protein [Kaistia dalseonensis]MCX5495470.1 cupin domain-containing protein [Kaistia dalseonensis]MDQ0438061.1 quercetin dioxygenase-like cupin family protein [Kaistia dalseonensis]
MNAHNAPSPIPSSGLDPKTGTTVHLLGTLVTFKATALDTEGTFSLVEATTAPGQGTPPHIQRDDAEAFYVLEGTFDFMVGGQTSRSGPGSFHYIPRGAPHGFANNSDKPARMLIINLPGGLHENFFVEAGDPVADATVFPPMSPPDIPRLIKAASRYGIEMLPPA